MTPRCPYCGLQATLVTGDHIYPKRPDLRAKQFWRCDSCDAHVGCHRGTQKALGRLANAELRRAKQQAHSAFDRLWRGKMVQQGCGKKEARTSAYQWLAEQLQIHPRDCHIGHMDVAMCGRVIEVCAPFHAENRKAA